MLPGFNMKIRINIGDERIMDAMTQVQQLLALICVLISAILVFNTISNLITQQTNQIGILKAIGGRTPCIVGMYLVSALVYGALAFIIALSPGSDRCPRHHKSLPEPVQYRL